LQWRIRPATQVFWLALIDVGGRHAPALLSYKRIGSLS